MRQLLISMCVLIGCDQSPSTPPTAITPAAELPEGAMEVPASAETARATGIIKWHFNASHDGTLDVAGLDATGHKRFAGGALPRDKNGITEFRMFDGVLQIDANGKVVKSTLTQDAIAMAGRLHDDTEHYMQVTNVALSPCSQAVDYYNACAVAAAIACAACVAQPETCAACLVALNFEGQARSAMNEICGSDGCGNHCYAPFSCDPSTGNCICVSSCTGPMCGQTDSCGNACPSWDIDACGVCGGDGGECAGPSCTATWEFCNSDEECCSGYCIWSQCT